jgi:outer membrane protein
VKKTLSTSLSLLSFVCLAAGSAMAQTPQKVGVLDMQSALISTKDGQKAVADLRAKFGPKDQELQKRTQELTAKQEQYRKTQNTMSEAARAALERDIDTLGKALQRDSDDAKQDMDQDQQRMIQELGAKMMQVINQYAVDNHFSLIFDDSGQPNNILYASTAIEVTRDVIALYDKAAAVTPAAPPAAPQPAAPQPAAPKPAAPKPSAPKP